jgi:hypothetical protein
MACIRGGAGTLRVMSWLQVKGADKSCGIARLGAPAN